MVAVRYPSIPMAELRLAIPLDAASSHTGAVHELLAATLLHGTPRRSRHTITDELAVSGAALAASRTSRWLGLTGSGPAAALPTLLAVLADSLTGAAHADDAVHAARDRARRQIATTRRQPQVIASEALLDQLYGDLPRMQDVPRGDAIAAVGPDDVRHAHRTVVRPDNAFLVLVGDLAPRPRSPRRRGRCSPGGRYRPDRTQVRHRSCPSCAGPARPGCTGPGRCSPRSGWCDRRSAVITPTSPP